MCMKGEELDKCGCGDISTSRRIHEEWEREWGLFFLIDNSGLMIENTFSDFGPSPASLWKKYIYETHPQTREEITKYTRNEGESENYFFSIDNSRPRSKPAPKEKIYYYMSLPLDIYNVVCPSKAR